jgi:predicted nuclease of predicted toxin-antitoxin system
MKLKLDENLPEALLAALGALGHNVDNVLLEGLAGQNDGRIWEAAQDNGRFLITQDLDFSDIRKFAPGTHCGLMLVRLRNPGRKALAERIVEAFTVQDTESWARCFVLLTDHKVRVRRPAA